MSVQQGLSKLQCTRRPGNCPSPRKLFVFPLRSHLSSASISLNSWPMLRPCIRPWPALAIWNHLRAVSYLTLYNWLIKPITLKLWVASVWPVAIHPHLLLLLLLLLLLFVCLFVRVHYLFSVTTSRSRPPVIAPYLLFSLRCVCMCVCVCVCVWCGVSTWARSVIRR